MDNNINVRGSGDGVDVVGYITAAAGMPVKFQNFPDDSDLSVTAVDQDIVSATGIGSSNTFTEYAFFTYIGQADAETAGWPTGTNSIKF